MPKRQPTAAARLAEKAGLTIDEVCRDAFVAPRYFAAIARNGTRCAYTAERLAHVLQCDPQIFLYGLEHYEKGRGAARGLPNATPVVLGRIGSAPVSPVRRSRRRRSNVSLKRLERMIKNA